MQLRHYALVDYVEIGTDGWHVSAEVMKAFMDSGWKHAVLCCEGAHAMNAYHAIRHYIKNHGIPVSCKLTGDKLLLERTDYGD